MPLSLSNVRAEMHLSTYQPKYYFDEDNFQLVSSAPTLIFFSCILACVIMLNKVMKASDAVSFWGYTWTWCTTHYSVYHAPLLILNKKINIKIMSRWGWACQATQPCLFADYFTLFCVCVGYSPVYWVNFEKIFI